VKAVKKSPTRNHEQASTQKQHLSNNKSAKVTNHDRSKSGTNEPLHETPEARNTSSALKAGIQMSGATTKADMESSIQRLSQPNQGSSTKKINLSKMANSATKAVLSNNLMAATSNDASAPFRNDNSHGGTT
jgi:hypothetical protein